MYLSHIYLYFNKLNVAVLFILSYISKSHYVTNLHLACNRNCSVAKVKPKGPNI